MLRDWVVFSSSSGHTFHTVWRALNQDTRDRFRGLFIDRACGALELAKGFLPPEQVHDYTGLSLEDKFLEWYEKSKSSGAFPIIFLIGYFKIITPKILGAGFPLVNTHPSLLPSFPGLDKKVHSLAYENSLISGFSVHLVSEKLDAGPIIFQKAVNVADATSAEEVREIVRRTEQAYLPSVIGALVQCDIKGEDRNLTTRELRKRIQKEFGQPLEKLLERTEGLSTCAD